MALDPDRYRLSEADHQTIFENGIKLERLSKALPSVEPVAVIFGGQPGSGKTIAVDHAVQELKRNGGSIQIIGDEFRSYHPGYGRLTGEDDKTAAFYTDRDTGSWVEKAIAYAKKQRFNIVIEGTMRDGDKVAATMESLRGAGYRIDARALAVSFRLSEQGILQRYEGQKADRGVGRMTTPEAHRAAYDGMLTTLERIEGNRLADRMTIYRRGAVVLYANELRGGDWMSEPRARAIVEAERSRPMSEAELRDYIDGFDRLIAMMTRPGRHATDAEIKQVEMLRQSAQAVRGISATDYWDNVAEQGRNSVAGKSEGVEQAQERARRPGGRTLK